MKQNSNSLKTNKINNQTKKHPLTAFSDFYVSIRKINYKNKIGFKKFPKYIILIEELFTGISFSSFSNERTSLSVAIFLEYFIENLKYYDFYDNYNFHISPSIKLSSNDIIIHIVKDKYKYNVTKNKHYSDFSPKQKVTPYRCLHNHFFSKSNPANSLDTFSYNIFANLLLFNFELMKTISECSLNGSVDIYKQIENLIYDIFPIFADNYITDITKIKNTSNYFSCIYSNLSISEFNLKVRQINYIIYHFVSLGKRAEIKYNYKLAEDIFSLTESIAKYYIQKSSTYLELNNSANNQLFSDHFLILKNIVSNLISSLSGLSYSYKLKGLLLKEISCLEEGIELSEKYDLIENEINLKNMLAICYASYQNRDKALELIRYIIKHPQTNKEQNLRAKITIGSYYFGKSKFTIAENIYTKLLEKIGEQYPEFRIIILLNLATTNLVSFKSSKAIPHIKKAEKCAIIHKIHKHDIRINDLTAICHTIDHMPLKAIEHYRKAIKLSVKRGEVVLQKRSEVNLGNLYTFIGKYKNAITIFKSILTHTHKIENYTHEITLLRNVSVIYLNLKKYKIANKYAEKAIFLSSILKNDLQYFLSLISKINIHIEQLDIKKIMAIYPIFINMNDKIEFPDKKYLINSLSYKIETLKLLFSYKLSKSERLSREKYLIYIFNKLNVDINNSVNDEDLAELTHLYCRLFKYLYDYSKQQKINIKPIEESVKESYIHNKKIATELYTTLHSKTPNIIYKLRLKKIEKLPNLS